jgi:hypothetical protein
VLDRVDHGELAASDRKHGHVALDWADTVGGRFKRFYGFTGADY